MGVGVDDGREDKEEDASGCEREELHGEWSWRGRKYR